MPWLLRMLLNLTVLILLAYGYVGWKLNQALAQLGLLPEPRRQQLILVVIVLLNLYPAVVLVSYIAGSNIWSIALRGGGGLVDLALTYPFWVGLLLVGQLVPFLLLTELARLGLWLLSKNPATVSAWLARLTLLVACAVCVYTAIRIYFDTNHIRLRERVIYTPKLAPAVPELRIVHISDVQVDPRTGPPLVNKFVHKINGLNPDVVFFSGDLVTSGTQYIEQAATLLGQIKARHGVFACLGDHDYWADPQWITRSLRANGIDVIEDNRRLLTLGSSQIELTGVTNIYNRRPRASWLQHLAGTKNNHLISVFLTHQPTDALIGFARENGYDLFLAGHTHGGQVVLNYFGIRLTPVMLETSFLSGFYQVGHMLVSVSNGFGLTFAPVRFQAPAEITLLRLRPAESPSQAWQ
ncbi:MAG: metallophosphoesterase [Acidobacteria bacterium]|nr:metallophosphoesterase [Acidobacteriota bacterium]